MSRLVFVRHSLPILNPDEDRSAWPLSREGRKLATELGPAVLDAQRPALVVASAEVKAIETAELFEAGEVTVDDRLGEVAKPWFDSGDEHRVAVIDYLSGADVDGFEPQDDALRRFSEAVEEHAATHPIIVTHGTILTLWLASTLGSSFDAGAFWLALGMPDAYLFDLTSRDLQRVGGNA